MPSTNTETSSTPTATSFLVTEVFDLPRRSGLTTRGKTLSGKVRRGMLLRDRNGGQARVLALHFPSPRDLQQQEITIMLERTDPSPVHPNALLTEARED